MAVLKKVAVPLLLAAAAVLLLAGPADAAFRLRSLKNNDGGNNGNDNDDGWSNNNDNMPQLQPPTISCGLEDTVAPESITVQVCPAEGDEAKHGFRLEWLSEDAFVANNGFGCNGTDAAEGLCAAKISRDNIDEDGCATFVIGESDLDDVRFKPEECGDLTLACGQTFVFRAFALGGRNRRTSEPSEPLSCSTEECLFPPTDTCDLATQECVDKCDMGEKNVCAMDCPMGANMEPLERDEFGACICPDGQFLIGGACACPPNTMAMGDACVAGCDGLRCNPTTEQCMDICDEDTNDLTCALKCPAGADENERDIYGNCVCEIAGQFVINGECACAPGTQLDPARDGMTLPMCAPICTGTQCDPETDECVAQCDDTEQSNVCALPCPDEATRDAYGCCTCPGNQEFNSETGDCECSGGSSLPVTPLTGTDPETDTDLCVCPENEEFNDCDVCVCVDGYARDEDGVCQPIVGFGAACLNIVGNAETSTDFRCGACVNNCGKDTEVVCTLYGVPLNDPKCQVSAAGGGGNECGDELVCCAVFKPDTISGETVEECQAIIDNNVIITLPFDEPQAAIFDAGIEETAP